MSKHTWIYLPVFTTFFIFLVATTGCFLACTFDFDFCILFLSWDVGFLPLFWTFGFPVTSGASNKFMGFAALIFFEGIKVPDLHEKKNNKLVS